MKRTPAKLGNVWPVGAALKIIDDSIDPPRWKTIAECMDTPNKIQVAAQAFLPRLAGCLWVHGQLGDRYMLDSNGRKLR